jgi:solute carrier family 27 fatty acid transporter 1/4
MDEFGYFYFKDRKGDTFRWKGENVSTTEVESIISTICGLKGAVVFGVEISGTDGRAGMVVISDPQNTLDLNKLAEGVIKSLPSYARPLFLRIVTTELDMTGKLKLLVNYVFWVSEIKILISFAYAGTYKLKKNEYQKAGFDINCIEDKMYYFNGKQYIPMDKQLYEDIISRKIRV